MDRAVTVIELIALFACFFFGALWIRFPNEAYEPPFAISGLILVTVEIYRRHRKANKERSQCNNNPGRDTPDTPKGWSIRVDGGEHIELKAGERKSVRFPDGRIETYLVLNNDVAAVEQTLPAGQVSYFEIDKNGGVITRKLPFALDEYTIDVNPDSVLREAVTNLENGYTQYTYNLKWGNSATWVLDDSKKLRHFYGIKYRFDNVNKIICVGYDDP